MDNRKLSCMAILCGYVMGWYALVLVTSPPRSSFPRRPSTMQWYGMAVAMLLGMLSWASKTMIFAEEKESNEP